MQTNQIDVMTTVMTPVMDSLVTMQEASVVLGVSERTLRYRAGRLYETPRGRLLLRRVGKQGMWLAPLSVWRYLASIDWRARGQRIRRGAYQGELE